MLIAEIKRKRVSMKKTQEREVRAAAIFPKKFSETSLEKIERQMYTHFATLSIPPKTIVGRKYRLLAGAVFYQGEALALIEMRTLTHDMFLALVSSTELELWTQHFKAINGTKHPIGVLFPHQSQPI